MSAKEVSVPYDAFMKIVKQEVKAKKTAKVNEAIDHAAAKDIVTSASKLLAAVEAFQKNAPQSLLGSVGDTLQHLSISLEDMVSTPASYVAKPKSAPQKVTLKPVKTEENVTVSEADDHEDKASAKELSEDNYKDLEPGKTYTCSTPDGKETKSRFVALEEEHDGDDEKAPEDVVLKFEDIASGDEWKASFYMGKFVSFPFSEPISVKPTKEETSKEDE